MARQRKNAGAAGSGSSGGGGGDGKSSAAIDTKSTSSSTSSTNTTASTVDLLDLHAGGTTKSSKSSLRQKQDSGSAAGGGGGGGGGGTGGGGANEPSGGFISRFFVMRTWHVLLGCVCLAVASYVGYLGYLETRVNTPYDDQRMVATAADKTEKTDAEIERFWGSYRPGAYFGLKTRDPQSLVMGLMWFVPTRLQGGGEGIRHWCESGDNLRRYGWNQHDGRTFGSQDIEDDTIKLQTTFIKFPAPTSNPDNAQFGGDWTARITVDPLPPRHKPQPNQPADLVSLIWYTALDEKTGGSLHTDSQTPITGVRGQTPGLGSFTMHIHPVNGSSAILHESYLSTASTGGLHQLRQLVVANFRLVEDVRSPYGQWIALPGDVLAAPHGVSRLPPTFIATMITGRPPFALDIAYASTGALSAEAAQRRRPPIGAAYTAALDAHRTAFVDRFESTFQLRAKGYSTPEVHFAQSALSNLIGGIGYFYGASRVQSQHTPEPVPYWRAPLYTAVPSRSFFPRGFLWDEGFHGLLISAWDADIELDILAHWMDLMNAEGWIPREQILGAEARAKVPDEFVTQRNTAANPPTFFLTLKAMLGTASRPRTLGGRHLRQLGRIYPRLQAWFAWFNATQRGELPGTYRWRGRVEDSVEELNPKTLTSGLDDYPRASHPTRDERHVDLRAWMTMAAGVMADLAALLERDDARYAETWAYLRDERLLDELHLSPYTGTYADWGWHTDAVQLRKTQQLARAQPRGGGQAQVVQSARKVRVTAKQPEWRFVDTQFGYVSLFPFLLEQLSAEAPAVSRLLEQMRDPQVLWTPYGLRSLSRQSPLYMKRNTEQDPPYWRGQIWLNINYLALKALHHYGSVPGPWAERAREIYVQLRANVVRNVVLQYERTGFVWEQYSDATGAGSGCKPFTGWSALTVLMMAEQY